MRTANTSTDAEVLQTVENLLLNIETEKSLEVDPSAHGVRFDAQKAAKDADYQAVLFQEFGL